MGIDQRREHADGDHPCVTNTLAWHCGRISHQVEDDPSMYRRLAFALVICVFVSGPGPKTVHVKAYTRKDGTHVQAHYRSAPTSSSVPIASRPPPAALLPVPARSEPRTSAPVSPRLDPRVDARSVPAGSAASIAPILGPEDEEEIRAYKKAK